MKLSFLLRFFKKILPDVYKDEESNSYQKLFNCNAKHLDYLGLNFQSNRFYSITYGIKRIISLGLILFCNSLILNEVLSRKWEDANQINIAELIAFVFSGNLKQITTKSLTLTTFEINNQSLDQECYKFSFTRNELNELIEHVINTTNPDFFHYIPYLEKQLYEKYLNISRQMARVMNFLYNFTTTLGLFLPITTTEWFLVYFTVLPWLGYKSHPGYEISLILEFYLTFQACGLMYGFDNYFYYFTFYVCMKSDLCVAMVSKIGDYSSEYNTDEKQSLLLRELCLIQQDIQGFVSKLRKTFDIFVMGQGAFSLVVNTATFLMIKVSLLNFFILLSIATTQWFLLCFFGEMVLLKARDISNGIYCSQWYNLRRTQDKKILLHLLHNSQNEMTFSAMGIYDLKLSTFADIIRKAYGFYAFMQNIK